MATKVTSHVIADNAVTDAKLHSDFTATTQSASDNSTSVATTAYVTTAIANLADSAPSTLNTLNELAAALGDDANFSTTVTNSIATKAPLASPTFTGTITGPHIVSTSNTATQFKNATDSDVQHKFETNSSSDFAIHRLIGSDGADNKFIIGYGPNHSSTPNHMALKNSHASGSIGFNTGSSSTERMKIDHNGKIEIGNNIPMWSGEYGGALFLKGNNSTDDRFAEITTVDSNGATTGTGLVVKGAGSGINVGIGVIPSGFHSSVYPLIVGTGSGDEGMAIYSGSSNKGKLGFADTASDDSGSYRGYIQYDHNGDKMNIGTAGTTRSMIMSSGRTAWSANGIGDVTTVPRDFAFYTEGSTNGVEIRSNDHRLVMLGAGGSSGGSVDDGYVAIAASNSTTKIALNANGDSYFTGGDLGIGTTSIDAPIHTNVGAPGSSDKKLAIFESESVRQAGFGWDDSESTLCVASMTNHDLVLKTNFNVSGGVTRARFNISTNTSYTPDGLFGGPATPHILGTTGSGNVLLGYKDNGSGLYSAAMGLAYDAIDGLSNTAYVDGFVMRDTGNGTTHLTISTNGNIKNTNNSYGQLSDERIKSDIADASSQWNDIKAVKVRKFKLATQPAPYKDQFQIGVIAQELEAAGMNGLIEESEPDTKHLEYDSSLVGQKLKEVKYSVLHVKALKALQEAMARIETLEAKVATLESE